MKQTIELELSVVDVKSLTINVISINDFYFCAFKRITLGSVDVYPILRVFFVGYPLHRFPELLKNVMVDEPGHTWSNLYDDGRVFIRGACEVDAYDESGKDILLHINDREICVAFSYIEPEYEVVPLLHFYQVLLLLSEKILELAREYGTVAYYQKVEPQHYNPNWDEEMERLIGLLRERIAVESTR